MFESSPQAKIAIAYVLKRENGSKVFMIGIYGVASAELITIALCPDEV